MSANRLTSYNLVRLLKLLKQKPSKRTIYKLCHLAHPPKGGEGQNGKGLLQKVEHSIKQEFTGEGHLYHVASADQLQCSTQLAHLGDRRGGGHQQASCGSCSKAEAKTHGYSMQEMRTFSSWADMPPGLNGYELEPIKGKY